jgi:hypothetical protein
LTIRRSKLPLAPGTGQSCYNNPMQPLAFHPAPPLALGCAYNSGSVMNRPIQPLNVYQTYTHDTERRLNLASCRPPSAKPCSAPSF